MAPSHHPPIEGSPQESEVEGDTAANYTYGQIFKAPFNFTLTMSKNSPKGLRVCLPGWAYLCPENRMTQ